MRRLLIEHVDVIALDGGEPLQRDVSICVEGSTIRTLGDSTGTFSPDEVVDGRGKVALPGFFNAHCHSPMTLERGWAEDLPFPRWLNEKIWVAESALEEEDVYWGAALGCCEMIRSGIVAFADHYFWMDQTARAVEESGLKALLGWCFFGQGSDKEVGKIDWRDTLGFAKRWNAKSDGRIRTVVAPHSPYMVPAETLREAAQAAAGQGLGLHLHLSESEEQIATSRAKYGLSPIAHLDELGVFDVPVIAAHCNAVSDEDLAILARRGVTVAHTPKTYMKLAMRMAPVQRMLDAGVKVALGTDGPASNSDLNMLEVMRVAGMIQKLEQQKAEALPIAAILRMATQTGAAAMGFADSGRIAPGARADLVLLDTTAPHWWPRHDLAAGVVYTSHPGDVTDVIVDGKVLMRDRKLLTLDEERIRAEAERRALRMVGKPMEQVRQYRA